MEFHEKLQALRKKHGLTQEQLAEKLFVSRTAVSKWESGKGYPNIESLKCISREFGVSIDELLSGEELIVAAEEQNSANRKSTCAALIGALDVFAIMFILLPLYGIAVDGHIHSVSLYSFTAASGMIRAAYWMVFAAMIVMGIVELAFVRFGKEVWSALCGKVSVALSAAGILFFAAVKEPYVIALLFMFFMAKVFLLIRQISEKNAPTR